MSEAVEQNRRVVIASLPDDRLETSNFRLETTAVPTASAELPPNGCGERGALPARHASRTGDLGFNQIRRVALHRRIPSFATILSPT